METILFWNAGDFILEGFYIGKNCLVIPVFVHMFRGFRVDFLQIEKTMKINCKIHGFFEFLGYRMIVLSYIPERYRICEDTESKRRMWRGEGDGNLYTCSVLCEKMCVL